MISHLKNMKEHFNHLEKMMADPDVLKDQTRFQALAKERSDLEPIIQKFDEIALARKTISEANEIMWDSSSDPEFVELAEEEAKEAEARLEILTKQIKRLLLPKDPLDSKNILLEIRAGAGGDEAALFAGDLLRMYQRYADTRNWKTELVSGNPSDMGGYREVIMEIIGQDVYSKLKFESGVHRVQRIPTTETSGRIHTSTVTVAVLPEAEEVDIAIEAKDLRIDVFRASGCGGQCVNTTDSAVRITHIPTNTVVSCQDGKSQHKNKEKGMKVLRSRLLEVEQRKAHDSRSADRKNQVGTGDRSERVRTYNFPQGRLTDHRIGLTLYKLPAIMEGDIIEIIEALAIADQEAKMTSLESDMVSAEN